jgi:hypothetical protein
LVTSLNEADLIEGLRSVAKKQSGKVEETETGEGKEEEGEERHRKERITRS